MKAILLLVFGCLFSSSAGWEYPGLPGKDCPTTRERLLHDPNNRWIIPKCNPDRTFVDLQCHDQYPDICFCVAPDGSPLTLPGFGLDVKTCDCFMEQYRIFEHDKSAEMPKCANDGSYEPLQCSKKTGECWCVDRKGNVLVPPSKDIHDCSN